MANTVSNIACRLNKKEKVLIQVNNAEEIQKFGYQKEQLLDEFKDLLCLIEIIGLMNMAPLNATEKELCKIFKELREFRDTLGSKFEVELPELSMGMSNDYRIAVQEGATMIRIGRKLFN